MRIYKRGNTWWIEVSRGHSRSLRTEDDNEALAIMYEMELERLRGRVPANTKAAKISEFIEIYAAARGDLSSETARADRLALNTLQDAVGDINVGNLTIDAIDSFKAHCRNQNVKAVSINTYLRHIKAALKWAVKRNYLAAVPEIEFEKTVKRHFRILTPDEIKKLLQTALERRGPAFHAYLQFLLGTGARRKEAMFCRVSPEQGYALMTETKGKRDRRVPLANGLSDAVRGHEWNKWHPTTVTHWFRQVADECGLHDVRLHDLRHNSATYMVKSGINIRAIQTILGHRDVKTTEHYAKVLAEVTDSEIRKLTFA